MNNEYNELLFWKVFKNKYLLSYILKNKCCHKSKKFKTITSIGSMIKHKQYQLLICKLKADENLIFKRIERNVDFNPYDNDDRYNEIINKIEDIEVFKEVYSLLLFKGYLYTREDPEILFREIWGIKSVGLFDIYIKYRPEELQTFNITTHIDSIFEKNHPKLIKRVLKFFEESINHNKPFTLTKNERNYLINQCLYYCEYGISSEDFKEKMKIISSIPISPSSIFQDSKKIFSGIYRGADVACYLKYQKSIPFGFKNIQTRFSLSNGISWDFFSIDKLGNENIGRSVYRIIHLNMLSSLCFEFDYAIYNYIKHVKGNFECISLSINSVLLYFKLYYCNNDYYSNSKSIPASIQTQIDLIIENGKHRRCTISQSIKQLFQLLIIESKSIILYAFYLKKYNEPIDTIQLNEEVQLLLIYYMTKTYNTNILKYLLKKNLKINVGKLDSKYICESYFDILFKNNHININDIFMFYKIYTSQKSIIIEYFDEKPLNDVISTKKLNDLGNKQVRSILGYKSSSKWKEITSNLIDNDMIVTIKDKETIDWLSDIETGGCSILNIRNALHSKLKQMKLDFSTSELLDYARIKFKQVLPILDSNKQLCNIHILRTHDDIESLINGLNQSNFNDNKDLFKYYMIQVIQFGSRNSMKYLRFICDSIDELLVDYTGWGTLVIKTLNYNLRRLYINSYLDQGENWDYSAGYHENEKFQEYKIPTQQTCQIINLSKIKVNFNNFPNETSFLLQTFIELLNFEGVQFILDNLIDKDLILNEKAFKDHNHDRIYTSKYLYKDLIDMILFLINKFKDCQLSLPNLSLILNFLYLKLIRVNNLTIDQIKTAHQLISNYIEIDRSAHISYYYLKILSPIIASYITIFRDPKSGDDKRPLLYYNLNTSVYTFEYIFTSRNNNDLYQFIISTVIDIGKVRLNIKTFSKILLDHNNPRINLFLHYFENELKFRKENRLKKPFLEYNVLKLIIKTFDLESFIILDTLFESHNGNDEQEGSNNNRVLNELENCYSDKPLSSNMVEWFGIIIYKNFSDKQDIIDYLFKKYKHQLEPFIMFYKSKPKNIDL
ncbi:hypothetical protein ACTFIT_006384 [Dictyostelium discoideum]